MKRLSVLALALPVLLLPACGSTQSSPEDEVRATLSQIADSIENKEYGNICDHMSPKAIDDIEQRTDGSCEAAAVLSVGFASDKDLDAMRNPDKIEIDGNIAHALYDDPTIKSGELVNVDGEWMIPSDAEVDVDK